MSATTTTALYVTKRDGSRENVSFDKVTRRIHKLCTDPLLTPALTIDCAAIAQKVVAQIYPGVTTVELDELAAHLCSSLNTTHPQYAELAKRIVVSNHHKNTRASFATVIEQLHACTALDGTHAPLVSDELLTLVRTQGDAIEAEIDYQRDYAFDYFGFKTLEKSYLLRLPDKTIVERPQHLWMRVALGLYGRDVAEAFRCYHELSTKCYTHATPTLFNSGTAKSQLASCFLLAMRDDSIQGIFETLAQCATISKYAGGIGLHVNNIRSTGSWIRGTNGTSNGLVPMLRVFNDTARYVDQGGGKRNGSFAIYCEPWHADIFEWLHLKRNHGDESARARDLFYALWTPDLFMERVKANGDWTLFNPDTAPGLADVHGAAFKALYERYEQEGRGKTVKAQALWMTILESMVETGTPYILFKDACNAKSNQQNLGTIKSSNLCTEIVEYSSKDETAVCNLASISLPACVGPLPSWADKTLEIHTRKGCAFCGLALARLKRLGCTQPKVYLYDEATTDTTAFKQRFAAFANAKGAVTFPQIVVDGEAIGGFDALVNRTRPEYDFAKLGRLAESIVRNLNQTIDRTFYPTPETRRSNLRHRPIGLGVQGLADVFFQMRYPFDSAEAKALNARIFATLYYYAMKASCELAQARAALVAEYNELVADAGGHATDATDALRQRLWPQGGDHATHDPVKADYPGAYSSYVGSPLSKGLFQFDLWDGHGGHAALDWAALKAQVREHGARNSLLVAPMPTASTAQILGNTECFEAITSNIYVRRTLAGEFVVANQYLMQDLMDMGKWSTDTKDEIVFRGGSVQDMDGLPASIKALYKTVWEISQKVVLEMAADRGRYICQSQSMNLFLAKPTKNQISSMLMYAWQQGLKTGMYYLRTKPASAAQQFTLDPSKYRKGGQVGSGTQVEEGCVACSA